MVLSFCQIWFRSLPRTLRNGGYNITLLKIGLWNLVESSVSQRRSGRLYREQHVNLINFSLISRYLIITPLQGRIQREGQSPPRRWTAVFFQLTNIFWLQDVNLRHTSQREAFCNAWKALKSVFAPDPAHDAPKTPSLLGDTPPHVPALYDFLYDFK